ncbi:MAG: hypothetical protein QF632_06935 [Candidatus Woesearchaeota archaeon]|jgi:hypothetical protein|nr:hypothetical protein [Candidatus Woesearchaeota archaeon]MDP7458481.1 hypothetical protein [Candidatus Woesearchaeota archaeon]
MNPNLIQEGYIPFDKSWTIRMGVLDLVNGYSDSIGFLKKHYEDLGDDLQALYRASVQWNSGEQIDVGESGTLYRFLKFASWKLGNDKEFVLQGTLKDRTICDNPEIIDWPLEQLLTLDNGTSQWASASVLMGNPERIENSPYKLQVTYGAVDHWKTEREKGDIWTPRHDDTILAQASAYLGWLKEGKMDFTPQQAEDYCFARAFDVMTAEEGEELWPSLRGHESDRIAEMEQALGQEEVTSKDHRVIQAVVMSTMRHIKINYPNSVNKSWPQFWRFLMDFSQL